MMGKKKRNQQLTWREVVCSDLECCDIAQQGHQTDGRELRPPLVIRMLVDTENVFVVLNIRHWVVLGKDVDCKQFGAVSFKNDIQPACCASLIVTGTEVKGQILVIAEALVSQILS